MPGKYSLTAISEILGAKRSIAREVTIEHLLTDSRRITNASKSLFFALEGNRNGHDFIPELYAACVFSFVVKEDYQIPPELGNANFLLVKEVLPALQQLAAYHRSKFNLEVIAVTGSNGKTVVKEWLYQLLSPDKNVVRSPKSYNSQTGVPLSLWQIDAQNEIGIFEAGISLPGEMERLEAMIKPTIGVFTHFAAAHDEGFSSRKQKLGEKLKLFKNVHLLVYNQDQAPEEISEQLNVLKSFTISRKSEQADLFVFDWKTISGKTKFQALYQQKELNCCIPFTDEASIENALLCWGTMLALGADTATVSQRMETLNAVSMRLELKNGTHNCSIIDDSYNSDINSLEIALNFLERQKQHPKKTLILSDIYQSGLKSSELYKQVADLIKQNKIDKLIGVGKEISENQTFFQTPEKQFFEDTDSLLKQLPALQFKDETILLKGSRNFEFERISRVLSQKTHETILEINLNALQHNLNYYKSILKPGVKLMAMVKAFSYGSGSFEIAGILQFNTVDFLAVAYVDEGVALRNAGITLPIMVLNPEVTAFEELTKYQLEPEIYSFNLLEKLAVFINEKSISSFPVHLKIDTGMHRLGFEFYEVAQLCQLLKNNPQLKVKSVFSHLAASGSAEHDDFTFQQFNTFKKVCSQLEKALGYTFIKHISNTSAISRWPEMQLDMVRLGIGLYGIDTAIDQENNFLQPVATLKTSISQLKKVKAGETIGYGRNDMLEKDGKIATVRIGYADGYLRVFGNGNGKMLINGKYAPTIGHVSMDMCMLDVSDIEVQEDDEVIVFNEELRIETLAAQAGTIPYEILTNISQRVKRVYYYE
ncbi:bifunctional UDP-N-acetylmuramoyl-tripeptide:D-alanyl-D-alanine ligase/alanine racemase [Mucilaginibacter arboris]|uniref:Alanine racemase n=1 Tax=Mucilaginibacter arboris TaxID=2682090 RepID=A0A7K1SZG0_9SPHI|nr:bifunctional UDP-N-acetylmuramoyl-tripeptide:D-alanyl-D-alanine ligase/alanine racemase [Mucilaginibacter arboris]MVN22430.1 bifunctional UDP-N-acetylmuramoyl-tripeptide:D-alanyl-D-alanine ligase/alanine racemase [Mucilaginibacter arboris]